MAEHQDLDRYRDLIARGKIRFRQYTTDDLDRLARVRPVSDVDPLDLLLAMRREDGEP